MLPEERRKQLDGIVQQMVSNKEPDSNIQFVVDDFKTKYIPPADVTPDPPVKSRNILQSGIGLFLDAPINLAARAGQAVGDLALTGVNKISGGALDKYTPEGNLSQALNRAQNTPRNLPLLGTPIRQANQITAENTIGDAVSTVALGAGSPATAGALLGAGSAMSQDKSAVDVGLDAAVGAISGKILQYGFKTATPYVEKAVVKYGQPFLDRIEQYVPQSSRRFVTGLSSRLPTNKTRIPTFGEKRSAATATARIEELVSAKPTIREAQLAQSQGRLIKGKEPTLLRGGTPDVVIPTKKIASASEIIMKNIPNASKMSSAELYTAVDTRISTTAAQLRPKMKQTPLKSETIHKMSDDLKALKIRQMAEVPASEEANVLKRQRQFEEHLKKNAESADPVSQDWLWDVRVSYDNTIPVNVKKATSMSSESLQIRKEEWLQNRGILNDAINSPTLGMGAESEKAFYEMSSLYEAKQNLLQKAKINTTGQSSKVSQFLKKHPYLLPVVGSGAAGATGVKILEEF